MPDLLLYDNTRRSAALRHEVPVLIGDPFLYAEVDGTTYIMSSSLEGDRIAAVRPDATLLDISDLGFYELLQTDIPYDELWTELAARAAARAGVRDAIVDYAFPLGVAERLRSDGITLHVDDPEVRRRRRVKSATELEGIRRAQRAAEAAVRAATALLKGAEPSDGTLRLDGQPLTAEQVRTAMRQACWEEGALLSSTCIVASVWQGTGHEPGHGPLPAGLPIEIDLWPEDEDTGCFTDMTRTFVVGEAPAEVVRAEGLVREAIEQTRQAVRPGITGRELHGIVCELFEDAGYRTQRTGPGEHPHDGFQFALGHGVGLEVHEDPGLGVLGREPLVAGDVLAVEPGLWDHELGGVRYEDLLLVTEDGCETLTDYPYGLSP